MSISISNIAWDTKLDSEVSLLLKEYGVTFIDVAPTKYFPTPSEANETDIKQVKDTWSNRGMSILGMQSLLFGTEGLNVFGSQAVQAKMLSHLTDICRVGKHLGASSLVFGSPRNRDRSLLDDDSTLKHASSFFRALGDIAKDHQVDICLEPNPSCYNANFMTTSLETFYVVEHINHPNIKMQLDIGAMCINEESPKDILQTVHAQIGHIHISEPQLAPLNKNNKYHRSAAESIQQYLPNMPIAIEILTSNEVSALQEIEQSLQLIKSVYLGKE